MTLYLAYEPFTTRRYRSTIRFPAGGFHTAAAGCGMTSGRSGEGDILRSAKMDVMCRARSSGTSAEGIRARGSSLIGAPEIPTLISR